MVSLSSEVSPQMREYERFNTTIANAYIKPLMKSYLGRLRERLAAGRLRKGLARAARMLRPLTGSDLISLGPVSSR